MKNRILYLTTLMAVASEALSQTRDPGGSFVHQYVVGCLGVRDDVFAIVRTPGGLPTARRAMGGFSGSSDFAAGAGGTYSLAFVLPRRQDAFGLVVDHLRSGAYRSSVASVSYGMRLTEALQIGFEFGLSHTAIEGYGASLGMKAGLGALYRMEGGLRILLHVQHLGSFFGGREPADARGPLSVRFGVGKSFSEQAGLVMTVFKEEGRPVCLLPMLQYRPAAIVDIRAGLATGPSSLYLSVGFLKAEWRLDVSVRQHGALGWASGLALQWRTKEGPDP